MPGGSHRTGGASPSLFPGNPTTHRRRPERNSGKRRHSDPAASRQRVVPISGHPLYAKGAVIPSRPGPLNDRLLSPGDPLHGREAVIPSRPRRRTARNPVALRGRFAPAHPAPRDPSALRCAPGLGMTAALFDAPWALPHRRCCTATSSLLRPCVLSLSATAYRPSPIAFCLSPIAYCLLPIANSATRPRGPRVAANSSASAIPAGSTQPAGSASGIARRLAGVSIAPSG